MFYLERRHTSCRYLLPTCCCCISCRVVNPSGSGHHTTPSPVPGSCLPTSAPGPNCCNVAAANAIPTVCCCLTRAFTTAFMSANHNSCAPGPKRRSLLLLPPILAVVAPWIPSVPFPQVLLGPHPYSWSQRQLLLLLLVCTGSSSCGQLLPHHCFHLCLHLRLLRQNPNQIPCNNPAIHVL